MSNISVYTSSARTSCIPILRTKKYHIYILPSSQDMWDLLQCTHALLTLFFFFERSVSSSTDTDLRRILQNFIYQDLFIFKVKIDVNQINLIIFMIIFLPLGGVINKHVSCRYYCYIQK